MGNGSSSLFCSGLSAMSDKTRTFHPITRAQVDAFRKALTDAWITVPAGDGFVLDTHKHGVVFDVNYSEPSQLLMIFIAHTGLFVTDQKVWDTLAGWGIK